jgi:hypothetical protein
LGDLGEQEKWQQGHVLAPVYDWFTERFETRDLKQANARSIC